MPITVEQVEERLRKEMKYRRNYNRSDFIRVQLFAWASILASGITSIATAYGVTEVWKLTIAGVAAIPALMVAIEGAFKFSTRYRMNNEASLDIEKLLSTLNSGN